MSNINRVLYVGASIVPGVEVHHLDSHVAGIYSVKVDSFLPDEKAASAVLDCFHSFVPIKNMEDFYFFVFDCCGSRIEEDPGHAGFTLANHAGDIHMI